MIVHLTQKWSLANVCILIKNNLDIEAGLMGFEPMTAGLRVRCATWLRYRPTKKENNTVFI